MECSRVEIEGIKLAMAKFRQTDSQDKRDVLLESIRWLKERYERLGEKEDLERILCHICAYAELGFPYEDVEGLLGQVLEYLNMGKEEKEKFRTIFFPKVPLNKTSINRLLGRWSPTRQSMKI